MVLTLYKMDLSPPVRSVMMVIEALGLSDVQYIDINLIEAEHMKEEFVKINPQHTIPLLKDDDFYIWDSHAIASYLVTKYGSNDALYPTDPQKRAVIDQRLHFDSGILFPALRGTVRPVFFLGEKTLRPENVAKIDEGYQFSEKFLTSSWMAGDKLTLADICCFATLSSCNEINPVDASLYPKLSAWLERCSQLEFAKKANQAGAESLGAAVKQKLA